MIKRTLHLTTPLMHGSDVHELQKALAERGYFKGQVDGAYGPLTAQAVFRAKFRLGYKSPDQSAGNQILSFLTGKKTSALMRARADARAKQDAKKHSKAKKEGAATHAQLIVQHALSQLGETEHPANSNRSKYNVWYGIIGAWCAMFVTWVHASLGFSKKTFKRAVRYAYVPFMVGDARAGQNGLMLAAHPADAIVVCYDWQHDGIADHTGLCAEEATLHKYAPVALARAIREFGPLGSGDFWAIEGNTAVGNDSNGGIVMLRKRNRSLVQAFVKVAA